MIYITIEIDSFRRPEKWMKNENVFVWGALLAARYKL
jgi:hypothetical protein